MLTEGFNKLLDVIYDCADKAFLFLVDPFLDFKAKNLDS